MFWYGYAAGLLTIALPIGVYLWFFGHLIFTNPSKW